MNLVILNTHDTGRFIQPYGHAVPTPNLMALARDATLFRNACSAAPTCSPSRGALLTGMMPHNNGLIGLVHRGFSLKDPSWHLAAFLKGRGYDTALTGIQHEAEDPRELGYERVLDDQDYFMGSCDRDWRAFDIGNANRAADYIKEDRDKPFFLSFGMFNTHRTFPEPAGAADPDYTMPPPPLCDSPENRRDMARYIESAKCMDECVGIVMAALRESGRLDDTLVVFTTDHGIAFPEMKATLYDTGIGVSLILRLPGGAMNGKVTDALVSQLDVFPTVCDVLGLEKPEGLQGESLYGLLSGQGGGRGELFAETTYHVAYEPMRCIRTQNYKYIRRYSRYGRGMPSNVDEGPDKTRRLEEGYYNRLRDPEMLFDLRNDPMERVNLADDAEFSGVKAELVARLDAWLLRTADPVVNGVIVPPDGAKVNYPDSPSYTQKVFMDDWSGLE